MMKVLTFIFETAFGVVLSSAVSVAAWFGFLFAVLCLVKANVIKTVLFPPNTWEALFLAGLSLGMFVLAYWLSKNLPEMPKGGSE